jgi:formamidopyrimidine-DNA glycosylase
MPELAEVEFHRMQWDAGLGAKVLAVELHAGKRIFLGTDTRALAASLRGAKLVASEAHGKQMLFRFTSRAALGLHLGMTGALRVEAAGFTPAKHDHLALRQARRTLVFADARCFGRVLFHAGPGEASWWEDRPPALLSREFTLELMAEFLRHHGRAPLKAVLLAQEGFPGVGNWMADEILWRAALHPATPAGRLTPVKVQELWRQVRFVSAGAMRIVAKDYSDPPPSWLFRHRWKAGGLCPKDGSSLLRETIGGRTTAWCGRCQPSERATRPRH